MGNEEGVKGQKSSCPSLSRLRKTVVKAKFALNKAGMGWVLESGHKMKQDPKKLPSRSQQRDRRLGT